MTNEINNYFTEKKATMETYFAKREEMKKAKDAAWGRNDEDEAHRLYDELKAMTCPLTDGEMTATRFWAHSADTMVVNDHLWLKDIHDFVTCLREAGVDTFLFTDQSTALMETIHEFAKEGLTLNGPETFTDNDTWNGAPRTVLALRFSF